MESELATGRGATVRRRRGLRLPTAVATTLLLLGTAVVVAVSVRTSLFLLVAPLPLALLASSAIWLRKRQASASRRGLDLEQECLPARHRWVPVAWVAFAFVSTQKFSQRSVDSASQGQLSIENVFEVGFYALIALVLVIAWLPRAKWSRGPSAVPLIAWPAWALLSTTWSLIPKYSLVRGLQLLVVVAFAVFTARVLDEMGSDGTALARPFWRIFTDLATALALFAFAWPYTFPDAPTGALSSDPTAPVVSSLKGRLAWYGVHPLVAAEILGTAALILAVVGPRFLRLSFGGWVTRLCILCAATGRTQGRSIIAGLVIAVLVAIWVRNRSRPLQRNVAVAYYVSLVAGALLIFHQQLFTAATRGEGTQRLFNLNGRIPLWQLAFHQIRTIAEMFVGFGLGSSRATLSTEVDFAGQSHNSIVEALLGTGLIGVILLLLWLGRVAWGLRSRNFNRRVPRPVQAGLAAVLGLLLILGAISPELASPGYSFSMLGLVAVFGLRSRVGSGAGRGHDDAHPRSSPEASTTASARARPLVLR
jgi:O-antigen ligase